MGSDLHLEFVSMYQHVVRDTGSFIFTLCAINWKLLKRVCHTAIINYKLEHAYLAPGI